MKTKTSYRLVRMRAGLTQLEAAEKAGVGSAMLSKIETGRTHPGVATLLKLADAYGCSIDELVGRSQFSKNEL